MPRPNRKQQVRETAARLFREQSYSATSMDLLSTSLGLNKGTLYHYYSSKAELLFDVLIVPVTELAERLESIGTDEPATVQLRLLIEEVAAVAAAWPNEIAVAFAERPWLNNLLDDEQNAALGEQEIRLFARISAVVSDGQAAGEFADVHPGVVLNALAGFAGYHFRFPEASAGVPAQAITESFINLMLHGLATGPPAS